MIGIEPQQKQPKFTWVLTHKSNKPNLDGYRPKITTEFGWGIDSQHEHAQMVFWIDRADFGLVLTHRNDKLTSDEY